MSAIRPCRGGPSVPFTDAPPGFRPSLRPSSLPPPPARLPPTKNSNREPLRLEIHATQRKQTTDHLSNRENNACFSDRDQPTLRPSPRISNRESLRLEIRLTQTKQRPEHDPNRENKVCLSNPDHSNKIRLKRSLSPTQ